MKKVIKEIKENEYTYQLGYDLWENNKLCPKIEIYKYKILFSKGSWAFGPDAGRFYFRAYSSSSFSFSNGVINTIKEMFTKLRQYSNIPEYIETEYENLFILYKLNDFKKL